MMNKLKPQDLIKNLLNEKLEKKLKKLEEQFEREFQDIKNMDSIMNNNKSKK